jgi:DNA-binding NtrC family response regulator
LSLAAGALERIRAYSWPGNVRELRNVIERAVLLDAEDPLGPAVLGRLLETRAGVAQPELFALPERGVDLSELECGLIRQALDRARGNRTRAGALLGLSRDTLRYRMEKHGLS